MKKYKLLGINQKQEIGSMSVTNDFNQIRIDIIPSLQKNYKVVFEKLVDMINQDANFKARFNNWVIEGGSKDFFIVLKQELMINLKIFSVNNSI